MRRTAGTAGALAAFALLWVPTASRLPPSPPAAPSANVTVEAPAEAYGAGPANSTGRLRAMRQEMEVLRRRLGYMQCSEGSPRSQLRTETGRYIAADEPRADCFESYKVKGRGNRGRSSREGRAGGNPSPRSYSTRPGKVGQRNKYDDQRHIAGGTPASDCVKITDKIAWDFLRIQLGGLATSKPCMSCDPTESTCAPGCQQRIAEMYVACDGVTMPDGFYFDPNKQVTGRWNKEAKAKLKIEVEKCGCSAAVRGAAGSPLVALALAGALAYALAAR